MQVWVPSKTVLSENSSMAIHIQNIFISAVFKKDCVRRLTTLYNQYMAYIIQKKACCGIPKHFIFHQKWDRWCTLIVKLPLMIGSTVTSWGSFFFLSHSDRTHIVKLDTHKSGNFKKKERLPLDFLVKKMIIGENNDKKKTKSLRTNNCKVKTFEKVF